MSNPKGAVHPNVATWSVTGKPVPGDHNAKVATTTVNDGNGEEVATVAVFVSLLDGRVVVHINDCGCGLVRVDVNDSLVYGPDAAS